MFRVLSNRKVHRAMAVTLAGLLLTALIADGDGPVGQARAASAACAWTKQTKRVVAHVRRNGRRHRVVHLKHFWTCREVAPPSSTSTTATTPSTPIVPAVAPAPPAEFPAPQPEPEANAVGVTADDHNHPFTYVPSRTTVRSGELTVQLNNKGEDPHNMDIQRIGPGGEGEGAIVALPTTAPSSQSTKSFALQPGTYRMWCTFANHAEEGMETHITVAE
jgi:plastocyanin